MTNTTASTSWYIHREHVSPNNEQHAAMCHVSDSVNGTWQDAKARMAVMVKHSENNEHAVNVLVGLVLTAEPVEILFGPITYTGASWTEGNMRWQIRQI